MKASKAFHYVGQLFITSKVDIAQGASSKYSMIL